MTPGHPALLQVHYPNPVSESASEGGGLPLSESFTPLCDFSKPYLLGHSLILGHCSPCLGFWLVHEAGGAVGRVRVGGTVSQRRKRKGKRGKRRLSPHFTLAPVKQLPLSDLGSLPFGELYHGGSEKRTSQTLPSSP